MDTIKMMILCFCLIIMITPALVAAESTGSIYDISVTRIDGTEITMEEYKDKVLLIVNTASKCGFTKQYAALQTLYERYHDQGLAILAFPSNDFAGQEPGSEQQIVTFCRSKFGVTFDLFEKISVRGKNEHPLFKFLTSQPLMRGSVKWNFNKFLIDKNGTLVARYSSPVDPLSKKITSEIERLLPVEEN